MHLGCEAVISFRAETPSGIYEIPNKLWKPKFGPFMLWIKSLESVRRICGKHVLEVHAVLEFNWKRREAIKVVVMQDKLNKKD